jgi:hypothetical protein
MRSRPGLGAEDALYRALSFSVLHQKKRPPSAGSQGPLPEL